MSQHVVEKDGKKFVFGWDQPLMSFFLQVHDLSRPEEDQIILWMGATQSTQMYNIEDLTRRASRHGLIIDTATRVKLYGEKDDGV